MNRLLVPALAAVLSLVAAGCGGGGDRATSKIESGKLDLTVRLDQEGGGFINVGVVTMRVSGPFQARGEGKLPAFDLDVDVSAEDVPNTFRAGATSTGEKGYLSLDGLDYAIFDEVYEQLESSWAEAHKTRGPLLGALARLGPGPSGWLTNPRDGGESEVEGVKTIKTTGGLDTARLIDGIDRVIATARVLGLQGIGETLHPLTDQQKQAIRKAIEHIGVELHTGREDGLLRRLVVEVVVAQPGASRPAKLDFDLVLSGVNADQEISEPGAARPFAELVRAFDGLGFLRGLEAPGGGGAGGSSDELEDAYSDCIVAAGSDVDKAIACADVSSP